jgi:hypothetical protein
MRKKVVFTKLFDRTPVTPGMHRDGMHPVNSGPAPTKAPPKPSDAARSARPVVPPGVRHTRRGR